MSTVRHTMNVKVVASIQGPSKAEPPQDFVLMSERVGKNASVSDVMMAVGLQLQSHLDALHDNEPMHAAPFPETRSITVTVYEEDGS